MTGSVLLYGAYGYTGRLIAARAATLGVPLVLAGRDAKRLEPLADNHGYGWRAFDLENAADELSDIGAVLHVAGPFSKTSAPMAESCLATGTHYIDITGEIDVFEALAARGTEAGARGVVLLPGAGFDVVPSDCLAAHMKRRLPSATALQLVIGGLSNISRGTAKTMLESVGEGTRVRRGGAITMLDDVPRGTADFGSGLKPTIGVSWGDVATAYHSTGIPDIDVFFESAPELERAVTMPGIVKSFLRSRFGQWLGRRLIDRMPPGPDEKTRASARAVMLAVAEDDEGNVAETRLETPEGYALTAQTALETALRVNDGRVPAGFQTPSSAFGPDYIMGFAGVTRRDLA